MVKTRLSVNVNKIALIRNSRGQDQPNLAKVVQDCEEFGAEGITVHPRPDQRHIRYDDIPVLKNIVRTELNIEGFPDTNFIKLVLENLPHQVTLVPDPPNVLTSNEGWDIERNKLFLEEIISEFKKNKIRVSLFVEPNPAIVEKAKLVGSDRIELYTGHYAKNYFANRDLAIRDYVETAIEADFQELGLNAGHDLSLENLSYFKEKISNLEEVSIGHALVIDSLYYGIKNTIQMYKEKLKYLNN